MVDTAENWVRNGDCNVCMVDWNSMSAGVFYPLVALRDTPRVAGVIKAFLQYLKVCHSVNVENVSIAGHSLGAHIGMLYEHCQGSCTYVVLAYYFSLLFCSWDGRQSFKRYMVLDSNIQIFDITIKLIVLTS